MLPVDIVVADGFAADAAHRTVAADSIPAGTMGLDIGPESVARFATEIEAARRLFWNGPMGVIEWESFRAGTAGIAEAVAACPGFSVVGGGDSVAAIRMLGRDDEVSHVSTGGGAGLEMLEGKTLPGVAALEKWSGDA
jgi:phosphoglycerate kinase